MGTVYLGKRISKKVMAIAEDAIEGLVSDVAWRKYQTKQQANMYIKEYCYTDPPNNVRTELEQSFLFGYYFSKKCYVDNDKGVLESLIHDDLDGMSEIVQQDYCNEQGVDLHHDYMVRLGRITACREILRKRNVLAS